MTGRARVFNVAEIAIQRASFAATVVVAEGPRAAVDVVGVGHIIRAWIGGRGEVGVANIDGCSIVAHEMQEAAIAAAVRLAAVVLPTTAFVGVAAELSVERALCAASFVVAE